jgi:hypothetical protein
MGIVAGVKLPRRKVTNILQGLLLVGFGLCLALVPFEVFQRVTKPLPSIDDLKVVNHEMLGVWNKPNLEFDHQAASGEFSNHFVRDENGFILYTPEGNTPPDDARRVMMLGDSFLEGHQVAPAENMSALLQNSLSTDATLPYHVLNTGRGGFSPLRYLLAYRTFAPDYQPDVVVTMVYVGNDFTDDAILFHSDRIVYDSSGEILALMPEIDLETGDSWASGTGEMEPLGVREHETLWPLRTTTFFQNYFGIRACVTLHREARNRDMPLPPAPQSLAALSMLDAYERYELRDQTLIRNNNLAIFKDEFAPEDTEDIQRSLSYLETLRLEVVADGADFVLVVAPRPGQVSNQSEKGVDPIIDSSAPQDLLATFCEEQEMTCIDLLPIFEEDFDQQLFWRTDVHFGPKGHALAAHEIEAAILATEP